MEPQHTHPTHHLVKNGLNSSSFISIGLVITIVIATWVLAGAINSATGSINSFKTEWNARMTSLETRMGAQEKYKESWTDGDMFRWAVHLQKENTSLKVPEPENHSGR